jgi:hypothetical protein
MAEFSATVPSSVIVPGEQQVRTEHLLRNLRGRAISGGLITVTSQSLKFGLTLASAMVLARLLNPQDLPAFRPQL